MILIVGCGDLGGEVARLLSLTGREVTGFRVSNKPLIDNIACLQADVTMPESLQQLKNLKPIIIIYCVAATEQTDENYRTHYVDGLNNVLDTQVDNLQLKHVFFVSSTRVYGQKTKVTLDEDTPAIPTDFGGERLLEAENLLRHLPCGATSIRLSGLYGKGRTYLVDLAKEPSCWPLVNRWSNRIHRDDAARFIVFMTEKVIKGEYLADCYIVTDDMPTLQYDVLIWLAASQNVDTSEVRQPTEQSGKRLSNRRLRSTGFQLQYANYQMGYSQVMQND